MTSSTTKGAGEANNLAGGNSMLDWSRKLVTSHDTPREAIVQFDDPLHPGVKRVAIRGDFETEVWRKNPQSTAATTWHYNQDGTIDGDKTGEWRLVDA